MNGNIWNLGNNHTMDCGEQGAIDTLEYAHANHCRNVGLGRNIAEAEKPLILEGESGGIGMLSVTYNVLAHAEPEFAHMPLPFVRNQYKKYLEFGADIVVGHHPHVVQNYEKFGDKIIFYSLGNFVFDTDYQRRQMYTDTGMLIKLHFTDEAYTWECPPIKIDRTTQTIGACECPDIFCNIGKLDYALLWPYVARNFGRNDRKVDIYLDSGRETWTKRQWLQWAVHKKDERGR